MPLPEVIPDGGFVQPFSFVQKLSDVFAGVFQKRAVNQESNPLKEKKCSNQSKNEAKIPTKDKNIACSKINTSLEHTVTSRSGIMQKITIYI